MPDIYLSEFYVYAYIRNKDSKTANAGTPYYIGKGKDDRAWDNKHTCPLPENKDLIMILESNLTEFDAFAIERQLIKWYGRIDLGTGILRNLTDGGDGISGYSHTDDTKQRLREFNTGKTLTEDHKNKIGDSNRGKVYGPMLDAIKLKISNANKGRILSPMTDDKKAKISQTKTGVSWGSHTEETKERIREANKGKSHSVSQDTKDKISNTTTGRVKSTSHRENLSKSHKGKVRTTTHSANISKAKQGCRWFTNGINNRFQKSPPDDTWRIGRILRVI